MRRLWMSGLIAAMQAISFLGVPSIARSQDEGKTPPAAATEKPAHPSVYRLEFTVREVEDGKVLNSRIYTMSAENDHRVSIRVGNRVPYVTGYAPKEGGTTVGTQFQYYDVGTNLDCRLHEHEGYILLEGVGVDISSVVRGPEGASGTPNPVVRSARASVDVAVVPGKPTMVTTLDDVSSNRRYEVEVTATKVK